MYYILAAIVVAIAGIFSLPYSRRAQIWAIEHGMEDLYPLRLYRARRVARWHEIRATKYGAKAQVRAHVPIFGWQTTFVWRWLEWPSLVATQLPLDCCPSRVIG